MHQSRNSPNKTESMFGATKNIQPEDNWDLTANPSVYLDKLPQPFKFVNTICKNFYLFDIYFRQSNTQ